MDGGGVISKGDLRNKLGMVKTHKPFPTCPLSPTSAVTGRGDERHLILQQVVKLSLLPLPLFAGVEKFIKIIIKNMKEEILQKISEYHKVQGVTFLSPKDAEDYFRGLVSIVEFFYQKGRNDVLKDN